MVQKSSLRKGMARSLQYVYPSNEVHTFEMDFYDLVWSRNLDDKLLLLIQISTMDDQTQDLIPQGYVFKEMC